MYAQRFTGIHYEGLDSVFAAEQAEALLALALRVNLAVAA
jgi:hypothetical protein